MYLNTERPLPAQGSFSGWIDAEALPTRFGRVRCTGYILLEQDSGNSARFLLFIHCPDGPWRLVYMRAVFSLHLIVARPSIGSVFPFVQTPNHSS